MILFGKKLFKFLAFIIITHTLIYLVLNHINKLHDNSNSIFVFGDSQMVQGLDLVELKKGTGLNVNSAAIHGAGIYDFFVFVNSVPNNSKVILSISKLAQIRPDVNEANNSSLNLKALRSVVLAKQSTASLKNILARNIKLPFKKYYKSTTKSYPNRDSITIKQPLEIFKNRYSISQKELRLKQKMYLDGVKELIDKGCEITFIEFPYHSTLAELDDKFMFKTDFLKFKKSISSLYPNFQTVSIKLPTNVNCMYDYSHLNQYGSNLATKIITKKINQKQFTTMYTVY